MYLIQKRPLFYQKRKIKKTFKRWLEELSSLCHSPVFWTMNFLFKKKVVKTIIVWLWKVDRNSPSTKNQKKEKEILQFLGVTRKRSLVWECYKGYEHRSPMRIWAGISPIYLTAYIIIHIRETFPWALHKWVRCAQERRQGLSWSIQMGYTQPINPPNVNDPMFVQSILMR